jgi:uncharacterized membrane protein
MSTSNSQIKETLKALTGSAVFASLIYFGLFQGVEWAKNIVYFVAWLSVVFSLFSLMDGVIEKIAEKGGRSVPAWFNRLYSLGVIVSFAAVGSYVLAAFYILRSMLIETAMEKAEKLKKGESE